MRTSLFQSLGFLSKKIFFSLVLANFSNFPSRQWAPVKYTLFERIGVRKKRLGKNKKMQ